MNEQHHHYLQSTSGLCPRQFAAIIRDLNHALERRQERLLGCFDPFSVVSSASKPRRRRLPSPNAYNPSQASPLQPRTEPRTALEIFRWAEEAEQQRELELLNTGCALSERSVPLLAAVNRHYRNKFFYSDYERSLYEPDAFWRMWAVLRAELRPETAGDAPVTWVAWRQLKAELRPAKLFTAAFIQDTVARKLRSSDTVNLMLFSYAKCFYEECGQLHTGRIDSIDQRELLLTLTDRQSDAQFHAKFWDIKTAPPPTELGSEAIGWVSALDKRALAAFIVILEQKHLIYRMLESLSHKLGAEGDPCVQEDAEYLIRRALIVEKHLGNVLATLRLSYSRQLAPEDLHRHYELFLLKMKVVLQGRRQTVAHESVKSELDLITDVLNRKAERKFEAETRAQLEAALPQRGEALSDYQRTEGKGDAVQLVKDCLLLVRFLQAEGDVYMDKNAAYHRLMEKHKTAISYEAAYSFADSLLNLISKAKNRLS